MERVRQKIKIEDLATNLKVTESNLQAVEDGDATRLPSELYFKLFAKSYAEELGIDYEATIEAIQQDIDESPISDEPAPLPYDADVSDKGDDQVRKPAKDVENGKNGNPLKKLAYILGAVVVIFIVVVVGNELFIKDSDPMNEPDTPSSVAIEPEPVVSSGDEDTSGYDWNVPAYAAPDPLTLVLLARSESWSTILADGDTAIYRTLTPGRRYEVSAKYRLRVSVGIPSAVTIELNGRPVNLRNPESGRIASVKIDQVNFQDFLDRPLTQTRTVAPPSQAPPTTTTPDTTTSGADDTGNTKIDAKDPSSGEAGTPEGTSEGR